MNSLKVHKVNESFLKIECDASTERELAEHFCFYVPGYKFMPAYRNRVWDGKIRLFDMRAHTLYTGLYNYLEEFCSERGYTINPQFDVQKSDINAEKIAKGLPLCVNKADITPRSYQISALKHALDVRKSLLLSPTASGKSLIIYMAIRYFLATNKKKILIIVPTTSLVEQMHGDFKDYSHKDKGFFVDKECHRIYSGKEKVTNSRVIISTWQSIHRLPKEWFKDFGMIIGDEAHQFKAKSLTTIMEKCVNAEYRIGTTGTLDGTQTHQLVLEGLFGPVHKVTTTKELMDRKDLAQLDISVLLCKYQDAFCKENRTYQEELDFIVGYGPRNNFISNLAIDQEGNTLILFNYVEKHGKPLHDLLREKVDKDRKLFYVSGETAVDARENIRSITEKEKNAIIVASIGTFSTGINIRNLHNIIFASPSKSQIRVLQSIGRGLRKSDRDTKVYDIADDLHWKSRKNYTLNHAGERIKIYSKEKFKFEIFEINI